MRLDRRVNLSNHISSKNEGYKMLAMAVIRMALIDYKKRPRQRSVITRSFFNTDDFIFYCDLADMDPRMIKNKLKLLAKKTG